MSFGNEGGTGAAKEYSRELAFYPRMGKEEGKPFFKVTRGTGADKEELKSASYLTGVLSAIFYNEHEEYGDSIAVILESNTESGLEKYTLYINVNTDRYPSNRGFLNQLLNAKKGDDVKISTYLSKGYSTVDLSENGVKETVTYIDKETGEEKSFETDKSYKWVETKFPEIESAEIGDKKVFNSAKYYEAVKNSIEFTFGGEKEAEGELTVADAPF